MRQRLRRAQVDAADADEVVLKLRHHGVLDDAAFAQYWVDQRQTFRPRGARLLRAELRQHGVGAALSDAAAQAGEANAEESAYLAAARRARQIGTADQRQFKQRLGQFLGRRGFGWETIVPVVDRLWREAQAARAEP